METIPLLKDLVILMAVSVPVTLLFHRLGMSTVVGFLIAGIIIGPHGLRLITEVETVELLAQIGIVLLLFIIGLEFSMTRMFRSTRAGLLMGSLQIILTTIIGLIIALAMGQPLPQSILVGFVISLSSTAIVLKLLTDRGEIDTPHGNLSIGILLFQDLCVVPMIIVLQTMGGIEEITLFSVTKPILWVAVVLGIILVASLLLVPRILHQVVRLRNREIFVLTVLLLCLGTAWLTSLFGLSLAIGAFIAGLVVSESEYSHQIMAEVMPFRDTFMSLFFISIGMLLEFDYLLQHISGLAGLTAIVLISKTLVLVALGQVLKYPLRLSIMAGLGLAQIGEFSFVLIKVGEGYGLLGKELYRDLLSVTVLTMAITPFLILRSGEVAFRVARFFRIKETPVEPKRRVGISDHVIIIGYGLNGQNLARVLKETGIPYAIVDLNWDRVKRAKKEGHRVIFGDASHPEIFKKVGVERARLCVLAISDPIITRRMVKTARELNPAIYILVRTRYIGEVEELYRLGGNQVIPEEFETSIEIFARVLKEYHIPSNIIQNQIDLIRQEGYVMLRGPSLPRERIMELSSILAASTTDIFFVEEGRPAAGKTLEKLDLWRKTGTSVIAVVRKGMARTNPPHDYRIEAGDILILLGSHAELNKAFEVLRA
ncbi:MAG: cation:proton antiporter [Deltaproteobacteria bacterium]|nr:cation:proton antiporter [Deltaproteobacteria bacterium]